MKITCPIIITKTIDNEVPYFISIPDIYGITRGKTVEDSIEMARDYIGLKVMDFQDSHRMVPASNSLLPQVSKERIAALVDVDIDRYGRKYNAKLSI